MTNFIKDAAAWVAAIVKAIEAFVKDLIANAVVTTSRTIFPFKASWDAGCRPAFLVGNRGIDRAHLDGLRSLLKESGKTKFTVCGTVTPLLPLLELMAGLPAEAYLSEFIIAPVEEETEEETAVDEFGIGGDV